MAKNKLQRFSEIRNFQNVIELGYNDIFDSKISGTWNKNIFLNNNPVVLELACGKGEYTIGLAKKNPNKNYVGIDYVKTLPRNSIIRRSVNNHKSLMKK